MRRYRRAASALIFAGLGVASWAAMIVMLSVTAAYGSCAAESERSPHAFMGEVLSVTADGKVATVRADDGTTVEVIGGPSGGSVTSVDRTYEVGVRYEFHPVNDHSPYRDNICTATHVVEAESRRPGQGSSNSDGTGVHPNENTSGDSAADRGGPQSDGPGQPSAATLAVAGISVAGTLGGYLLLRRRSVSAA